MSISPVSSSLNFANDSLTTAVVEPASPVSSQACPTEPALTGSEACPAEPALTGSQACPTEPADEQSQGFAEADSLTGSQACPAAPAKDGQSQIFARIYA